MEIKEVVVTGQNKVELQTREVNYNDLSSEEILIETICTFISTGTELANYTAKDPNVFKPGSWCAYPWRSGYANVGIVRAVGEHVTKTKVGERVFTFGGHASMIRYHQEQMIISVPDNIASTIAAASRMAGVATTAVILSEIKNDPWVVIFGLGMVGNLAAQIFRIHGCRVVGVDPLDARCQLAEKCGIPYTIGGTEEHVQKTIEKITEGQMANISVEAVGHSAVVAQALKATANYGQLILLGSPRVKVMGDLTDLLSNIHLRWITVRGALEWCLPMYPVVGNMVSQYRKQQMIFDWITRDLLKVEPLISHQLKPEQIKDAYDGLLNDPEQYTGVVLMWK
jgi:2-desacetyl-2-hydroxyethyl bacteriochlorophyllide A dehydrogenase